MIDIYLKACEICIKDKNLKSKDGVHWFNIGTCGLCGRQETIVTSVRNFENQANQANKSE